MYKEINDNFNESEDLFKMARVGYTNDSYEIYVNTDDSGNMPHFHYRKKGSWEGHTCICLEKSEYFHHEKKQAVLNKKQRKYLIDFLKAKPAKAPLYDTNWRYLVDVWNMNNSNVYVDSNLEMPDYMKLK